MTSTDTTAPTTAPTIATAPTTARTRLDTGWRFGGAIPHPGPENGLFESAVAAQADPGLDDASWERVSLPHTVTPLSWKAWDPRTWERVFAYRRPLEVPEAYAGQRLFLDFDGAITTAVVSLNGERLGEHHGGYLPFSFEVTDRVTAGEDLVAVTLDARFNLNVPPNMPIPAKSTSFDWWQPGGIHRDVWLRAVPRTFVADIALTHLDVLDAAARRSTAVVTLDAAADETDVVVELALVDGAGGTVATARAEVGALAAGRTEVTASLTGLDAVELWDIDAPVLYSVVATVAAGGEALHTERIRTGYREARFEEGGFFLNGTRRYLLGVNRHGYFPFTGFAMPDRVHRRDAEIIKHELNCAIVRCAHYPQTKSFLDACDELGLLVWEESPGWQYVGDAEWQDRAVDDITGMIARDRHRPSIVVWGARLNETPDRPELYARTEALVKALDPTRATSGTTQGDYTREGVFQHDVFSYDDYNVQDDPEGDLKPLLLPPVEGKPYLVSEAIATLSSPTTLYSRQQAAAVQQHQALDYAYAHDEAMGDERFSGLIAWVAFDYQAGMGNHFRGIRVSGLGDVFRILKPGAAIYRAQVPPSERLVLEPAFTWDPPEYGYSNASAGHQEDRSWGPGERAMICSNLDRLEVFLGDESLGVVHPDRRRFPNLPSAPSFVDLRLQERASTDLRIDGYLGDELVLTRRFSGDRTGDGLTVRADDPAIAADGVDATRVVIAVVDEFGEPRGKSHARPRLTVTGPGTLIGETPFDLEDTGGVAAVWVRSIEGEAGDIGIRAYTDELGMAGDSIRAVTP